MEGTDKVLVNTIVLALAEFDDGKASSLVTVRRVKDAVGKHLMRQRVRKDKVSRKEAS